MLCCVWVSQLNSAQMCWYITVQNHLLYVNDRDLISMKVNISVGIMGLGQPSLLCNDYLELFPVIQAGRASRAKVYNMWSFISVIRVHYLSIAVEHMKLHFYSQCSLQ